jgi:hypothetical protein
VAETHSKIAPLDSIDSKPCPGGFARKNFFTDSFWGLRAAQAKDCPRVAVSDGRNTPRAFPES